MTGKEAVSVVQLIPFSQYTEVCMGEPNLEEDAGRHESTAGVEGTCSTDVQVRLVKMLQHA